MNIDITWTITAIIAVSSIISSILVAVINAVYHTKIRKMELSHDEHVHQMNLVHQSTIRQFDIYYTDKKNAFSEFASEAGSFAFSIQSIPRYNTLHSSIDKAILFCNIENQAKLRGFMEYVDGIFGGSFPPEERRKYSHVLNDVMLSLNEELASTKPDIKM